MDLISTQNYFSFNDEHLASLNTIERQKHLIKQQQIKLKMASQDNSNGTSSHRNSRSNSQQANEQDSVNEEHRDARIQRKLFNFIYIYAIIIFAIYITYGAVYLYQHQHVGVKQTPIVNPDEQTTASSGDHLIGTRSTEDSNKLDNKLLLMERYIELIALDLEETKSKLREREKCDCVQSCFFNNTKYADQSSWQSECDICTCSGGKITCVPQKCPRLDNCDVAITLPGQCCPTCMKKCKYNSTTLRHGEKFKPANESGKKGQGKECKCYDGLIRCEQQRPPAAAAPPPKPATEKPQLSAAKLISNQIKAKNLTELNLQQRGNQQPQPQQDSFLAPARLEPRKPPLPAAIQSSTELASEPNG